MIHIQLLGTFRLFVDGQDLTAELQYDKVKLLLALLCLQKDTTYTRTQLADMLWPDLAEEQGRSRLRHALHRLRTALNKGTDRVALGNRNQLQLQQTTFTVDALQLVQLTDLPNDEARTPDSLLFSGEFLGSIKRSSHPDLEAWYMAWQLRCQQALLRFRQDYIATYQTQPEVMLKLAHQWSQQSPHEEHYHRWIIQAHTQNGDHHAALLAYQLCSSCLQHAFGSQPSAETFALLKPFESRPVSRASLLENEQYLPFATVAIAVSWQHLTEDSFWNPLQVDPEDALLLIQEWKEKIREIANQHHAWISDNHSTLFAHFGYPLLLDRPIPYAIDLALTLCKISVPPEIKLGLALHADTGLLKENHALQGDGLMYQAIIPLAWGAMHRQILLSPQAAARMSAWSVSTTLCGEQRRYELNINAPRLPTVKRMYGRSPEFDALYELWCAQSSLTTLSTIHLYGLAGLGKSQIARSLLTLIQRGQGRTLFLTSSQQVELDPISTWLKAEIKAPQHLKLTEIEVRQTLFQLQLLKTPLSNVNQNSLRQSLTLLLQHYKNPQQPLCIVWDNADLNDPTQYYLLETLKSVSEAGLVMLICISRQKQNPAFFDYTLEIKPLSSTHSNHYIQALSRPLKIPAAVKKEVKMHAMGNPLVIEEMIHLYHLGLPFYYVPRIADLLSNQLYSAPKVLRELAFLCACVEQTTYTMAEQILGLSPDEASAAFDQLIIMGLIKAKKTYFHVYSQLHKSALIQVITRQTKTLIYTKLAHFFIEHQYPAHQIAQQLHQARNAEATRWWRQAIHDALQQGFTQQAEHYLTNALQSYRYIEDSELRQHYEIEGYVALGSLQISHYGPLSPHTIAAYEKAASRNQDKNPSNALTLIWGRWVITHSEGQLLEGLQLAKQLQKQSLQHRNIVWYGWACYAEAQYYFWKGNAFQAESLLVEAIQALQHSAEPAPASSTLGVHSIALAFSSLALAQAIQGKFDISRQNIKQAIQKAKSSGSAISLTLCHIQLLRINYLQQDLSELLSHSLHLAQSLVQNAPQSIWHCIAQAYITVSTCLLNPSSLLPLDDLKAMITQIEQHLPLGQDAFLCLVSHAFIASGQLGVAEELLNKAHHICTQRQSYLLLPEILCLQGDIERANNRHPQAKRAWQTALQAAQKHQLFCYEAWIAKRLQPT
ncbi:AAA family ATPase [Paenalcaligenes hominis]|uniref:AAA family ATPase n=1 Tax=Paenalcaligenes hominis TaxID=643674 RepID=UPI003523DEC3